MKTDRKFLLGLLALIILCSCARAPQEIQEKSLVPAEPLEPEGVRNSIVRVVSMSRIRGVGNGFFVARNKVATNIHVVAHLEPVLVQSVDHEKRWTVEGATAFDMKNDLAILKVTGAGAPLPLGNSDTVQSGEAVSAVGYPKGKYTVSEGTLHSIRDSGSIYQSGLCTVPPW